MKDEFVTAPETAQIMKCSLSCAYKIMQKIREEMKREGLLTLAGVVPRKRWERKVGLT